MNLLVQKAASSKLIEYELHPLVREFVKSTFPIKDQAVFNKSIADVYREEMKGHKETLDKQPPLHILQLWSEMVELNIQASRWEDAFETLNECSKPLVARGYNSQFVRIAVRLFEAIDWHNASDKIAKFDSLIEELIFSLVHLGEFDQAQGYLQKFEASVPTKDVRYIHLCNMRCYASWFSGDHEDAISWGSRGCDLKNSSGVDTNIDCEHNRALARRDLGDLDPALMFFLDGKSLMDIAESNSIEAERGGAYYGNIGRCLQFMGNFGQSLKCFEKSAKLIARSGEDRQQFLNEGYIRQWVGEVLVKLERYWEGYCVLQSARARWGLVAPLKAEFVDKLLKDINDTIMVSISEISDDVSESVFQNWIDDSDVVL